MDSGISNRMRVDLDLDIARLVRRLGGGHGATRMEGEYQYFGHVIISFLSSLLCSSPPASLAFLANPTSRRPRRPQNATTRSHLSHPASPRTALSVRNRTIHTSTHSVKPNSQALSSSSSNGSKFPNPETRRTESRDKMQTRRKRQARRRQARSHPLMSTRWHKRRVSRSVQTRELAPCLYR